MVMMFGSSSIPVMTVALAPNNASISQSDYCAIATKDATKVRLVRPIVDGQGFETCNPGARIARFVTNSQTLTIKLAYTGLVTRVDTYNGIGWILVNGAKYQSFTYAKDIGHSNAVNVLVSFPSATYRTIEVLLPYCASVDFTGLEIESTATITPAASRPSTRLLAMGDSITHGFYSTDESTSWPYLLGVDKGWEVVNTGYGSRRCYPSDATNMAGLNPSVASYLIGYNDFGGQVPLASFKSDYIAFVNNFRALYPTVKLYCITPLWTATVLAIPVESYRQQIRDALTTLANPLNVLVEGITLTTGGAGSFNADGIHPNDTGAAEIASALASILSV